MPNKRWRRHHPRKLSTSAIQTRMATSRLAHSAPNCGANGPSHHIASTNRNILSNFPKFCVMVKQLMVVYFDLLVSYRQTHNFALLKNTALALLMATITILADVNTVTAPNSLPWDFIPALSGIFTFSISALLVSEAPHSWQPRWKIRT